MLSYRINTAAETPKYVPVASYINRVDLRETVGARVTAILRPQNIKSVGAGSLALTVSVPADRAAEALRLLTRAIKAEKLQLTLLAPTGDRFVVVTPDSVFEPCCR